MKKNLCLIMTGLLLMTSLAHATEEEPLPIRELLFTTTLPCIGLPLLTMASKIKDIRPQVVNDALIFVTEGEQSELLSHILQEIRLEKPELADVSDAELSKALIKETVELE